MYIASQHKWSLVARPLLLFMLSTSFCDKCDCRVVSCVQQRAASYAYVRLYVCSSMDGMDALLACMTASHICKLHMYAPASCASVAHTPFPVFAARIELFVRLHCLLHNLHVYCCHVHNSLCILHLSARYSHRKELCEHREQLVIC